MRLLRLSAEVEARAANLRTEALQCLTVALAGTDTKAFWQVMTTFFGSESDKDNVWDFIDPASRVAHPLDIESTDDEEEEASGDTSADQAAQASSSKATTSKTVLPRSSKVVREDVCPIEKAIRVRPQDEESLVATGIPLNLLSTRDQKPSGSSGASLYYCKHPQCDPPFVGKGGPAPLYNHIRRHHLGLALLCPYCEHKVFYTSSGWKDHMVKFHPSAPWYKKQVDRPEEVEAAALLIQAIEDPQSLGRAARRQDTVILDTMEPRTGEITSLMAVKEEEPPVPESTSTEEPVEVQESDIEFPTSSMSEGHDPPQPPGGHAYAFRSEVAERIFGPSVSMRYRTSGSGPADEPVEEEGPEPKRARKD